MKRAKREIDTMGTIINILVYHDHPDDILDGVEALLLDFNKRFSANDENSDLMRINRAAGVKPIVVDEDLFWLIKRAKNVSIATHSAFNFTIGPIVKLWRIGFDDARVPTDSEIKEKLPLINPHNVVLDANMQSVFLRKQGMEIDLGAIAKGYFADRIKAYLLERQVSSAVIDLGGNVLTVGSAPGRADNKWRIGIQSPFESRNQIIGVASIEDSSIVTSGIYERHYEKNGTSYHHIFDSKTGYPIVNDLASVSIFSEASITGEIWTTALFVYNAIEVINIMQQEDISGLVISKTGKLYMSEDLRDVVSFGQ